MSFEEMSWLFGHIPAKERKLRWKCKKHNNGHSNRQVT